MNIPTQAGRTRVMIVDPEWQLGLKLADCLATSGYQAVLVRNLESMMDEIGEIQPDAILLSSDASVEERARQAAETIRIVNTLCPQAYVLALAEPRQKCRDHQLLQTTPSPKRPTPLVQNRVEELVRAKLGIPCARVL
ncbi:MAG: protein of unknown function, putative Response regulator [Nitrospira sp.]|jgi:hypothetical protein|nr:protein of unknown function, putative Response regulator [Nitrospira sp.]